MLEVSKGHLEKYVKNIVRGPQKALNSSIQEAQKQNNLETSSKTVILLAKESWLITSGRHFIS